jgi:hypothetical protein
MVSMPRERLWGTYLALEVEKEDSGRHGGDR